jgi:carbon storage regulator
MLVLSRKASEKILIGNDVVVTITKIKGNRVWIGLEAPASIRIRRDEVPSNEPEKEEVAS